METEYGIINLTIEFFDDNLFINTKKDFIKINDYMLLKSSKNTLIIKKCGLLNELKHKLLKK